ncbi:MAG: DEAD/DEAH box helicase [Actinomycetota bacterium]
MEKILNTIGRLKKQKRFYPRIEHIELLRGKKPEYGPAGGVCREIKLFLKEKNIKLYGHQCKAIDTLKQGKNLVITTPTASGKTLTFNIPVFQKLSEDTQACALYIYPTKALANDQLKKIKVMEKETGIGLKAEIYDGDTPKTRRPWIRKNSRLIISNPYQIHHILSWHYQWERFYRNIKYVVIDEAHQYRGVFGSNIALLLRRLRRIFDFYGASPQFIISTATLANPQEFAARLTGLEFEWVGEDNSPRGNKYFVLYNPYYDGVGYYSTHQETTDLLLALLGEGIQTLCFTVSRKMAELINRWAKGELKNRQSPLAQRITSYRAGYLPQERREIEEDIRSGRLLGITSTNALELGIDIGKLDAVIISGFPGTIISTWQQAGRAGRGTGESLVVLVAFQNPLDQYLMKHPGYFFKSSPENAIIDLANPYINAGQLMCASAELPIKEELDLKFFDKNSLTLLADFKQNGLMKKTQNGWIYCGKKYPSQMVSLDSLDSGQFQIICEGKVMETMSRVQAYREAHQGAVMLHRGQTYMVKQFNLDEQMITVEKKEVDYHTDALKNVDVSIIEKMAGQKKDGFSINLGKIRVVETFFGYKIIKYDKTIGSLSLDLPPLEFDTVGFWFTIPQNIKGILNDSGLDFSGGIHGIEHGMIALMPLMVMCDRWDIGGVSYPFYAPNQKPSIFIYDAYEGGIGLSEKAFELFEKLVLMTYELVRDCSCENGCPACIYSPKCGNENQPLDKQASEIILDVLRNLF